MPVFIMINKSYSDEEAPHNIIGYTCRGGYGHIGGYGVDPRYAAEQMQLVKRLWGKE